MAEVHRIVTPPIQGNSYLILDEKNAVIDVGGDPAFLISKIGKYIEKDELDIILLTHGHFDHSGAAGELAKITGAEVYFHRNELELINNPLTNGARLFGMKFTPVNPSKLLDGGEILDLGDVSLEVIHTPGHSPGSICLYEREKKWLFSGDTVFPFGNIGRTDLPGGNPELLVESIKKLVELDVEIMYPGHDSVTSDNVREQILQSLKFAEIFQ